MAIFNRPISGLITKGLGGPAGRMLTMDFHVFGVDISVVPITSHLGGGGGGSVYNTSHGFYVPLNKKMSESTKLVLITVKTKDKAWRKSYVVSRTKGDLIVKAINFVDKVKKTVNVGITAVTKVPKKVIAMLNKQDK